MKKSLLAVALLAAMATPEVVAQTTYNFFDAADVDKDGWLWFDSQEKIDKYVGWNTKKKSFKIQNVDADYQDGYGNPIENITDPELIGFGTDGQLGSAGSYTGAVILPDASESFVSYAAPTGHGGGLLINVPDLAQLDICLSARQKDLLLACEANDQELTTRDLINKNIGMIKGCELTGLQIGSEPASILQGVSYSGKWSDIQNYEDDEFYLLNTSDFTQTRHFKIQSKPGEKRAVVFYNYMKSSPLYVHGIRVLTYTNTSGVADIIADGEDTNAPTYNVLGVRVDPAAKGIVIRNGHKYVNR